MSSRLPRFRRADLGRGLQLMERDRAVLAHLASQRFLDSRHLHALVGGSRQHLLRRLQRMFHHGFVDRPRAQLRPFAEAAGRPLVYGLSAKGARLMRGNGVALPRPDNRNVKELHLEHTLRVADVAVAFALACAREGNPRLWTEADLAPGRPAREAFQWAVSVKHRGESRRVGVLPDRVLALEERANGARVFCFVEADRATMPVSRRSLAQTSLLRKLLAYEASWTQGIFRDRFGAKRCRVLIVTSSRERAQRLAALSASLPRGRGLFLFTDAESVRVAHRKPGGILHMPWLVATGNTERLANNFARAEVA